MGGIRLLCRTIGLFQPPLLTPKAMDSSVGHRAGNILVSKLKAWFRLHSRHHSSEPSPAEEQLQKLPKNTSCDNLNPTAEIGYEPGLWQVHRLMPFLHTHNPTPAPHTHTCTPCILPAGGGPRGPTKGSHIEKGLVIKIGILTKPKGQQDMQLSEAVLSS